MAEDWTWMNGMTCLTCGIGHYDGYDQILTGLTNGCNICGRQTLAHMSKKKLHEAIARRDANRTPPAHQQPSTLKLGSGA